MSSVSVEARSTPEQYLERERAAEYKSEYFNGRIYAMAGASRRHNLITANSARELGTRLRDKPCEVYLSDMRVKVQATSAYTYPDVVVVCGEPEFEDTGRDTLLNPIVLIEVLSPSTAAGDRGHKFAHYRRLPSLQEYILVSQDRIYVERAVRQGEGWLLTEPEGPEAVLPLSSIGCEIALQSLYEKVSFPDETGMEP